MSSWIDNLALSVKNRQSLNEAIEKRLPESFRYLISDIEKDIAEINQKVYGGKEVLVLENAGDYQFKLNVINTNTQNKAFLFFDFVTNLLVILDSENKEHLFKTALDEVNGLNFTPNYMQGSGKFTSRIVTKPLIETLVTSEFKIDPAH